MGKKLHKGSSDNACHRKGPEHYNHVWSYDFVNERLENGRKVRLLVVIDEFTRECLSLDVSKHFKGQYVVEVLRHLFAVRGYPQYTRSDIGHVWSDPECTRSICGKMSLTNIHYSKGVFTK